MQRALHKLPTVVAPRARTIAMSATQTQTQTPTPSPPPSKREGDISDSFVSLSNTQRPPLPARFLDLKRSLVQGREDAVIASWGRLLRRLRTENDLVAAKGPGIVPVLQFDHLEDQLPVFQDELKKRGVAVVKGVIPRDEARAYKSEIEEYVRQNPSTRAFPPEDPQVYELYWSSPQVKVRSHPNFLRAQTLLMQHLWHADSTPDALVSTSQPLAYADRLRIRQPGDARFALGPHMDGGSVERWERHGYGRGGGGGVYEPVFAGRWEDYDPWDAGARVGAVCDNYGGLGACSMFRMFQGWLSMSRTAPREGTLMVNPLLRLATAYLLLRPFFEPVGEKSDSRAFLEGDNWRFCAGDSMTSVLQGAEPGFGQELSAALHPHLDLDRTMVHMPPVEPGDFVVWHCDTIHAVDKVHTGTSDSSVLYIPICPVTEQNAKYLARQRQAFLDGTPGPDFPGGAGESEHFNRPTVDFLRRYSGVEGLRAMGLEKLTSHPHDPIGAQNVTEQANRILGL
ncbi:hypothetical protein PG999_014210 [Apiospora kogelbergensis]|uniref:DUF1479 domain-containing protein n=1 Tax=Apiospora kogelbergensis TaxID=1337665 RepID=A0AAW0Q7K1_9PEZI